MSLTRLLTLIITLTLIIMSAHGCVYEPPAPWDEALTRWDAELPALEADIAPPPADMTPPPVDMSPPLDMTPPPIDMSPPLDMEPPPDPTVFRRRFAFELTWEARTPSGDWEVVDLDLHLLHPSFDTPLSAYDMYNISSDLDCYYSNMTPDWGDRGAVHDPSLDRDELEGLGAEVITLQELELDLLRSQPLGYRLVVHVYERLSEGLNGEQVRALIRVFRDGVELSRTRTEMFTSGDKWLVGQLTLNEEGAPYFELLNRYFSAP